MAPIPVGFTLVAAGSGAMYRTGDGPDFERRNSRRFPIHLEVRLKTAMEEFHVRTIDISAGGILFQTEADIQVHSPVQFTIEISAEDLGTQRPVLVKCQGRVVRCSENASGRSAAVTIDGYEFVLF
jgi:hypothetical protein